MIHVTAGYDGRNKLNTVERYNPQLNKWEFMNFGLPTRVESSCFLFTGDNEFLLIGGVAKGVESTIKKININNQDPKVLVEDES